MINIAAIQKLQSHDLSDMRQVGLEETVPVDFSVPIYPLPKPYAFGTEFGADRWLKMATQPGLQVTLYSRITVTSVICRIYITFLTRFCNPMLN